MKGNLCSFWANKALGQAVACEQVPNASNPTSRLCSQFTLHLIHQPRAMHFKESFAKFQDVQT